MPLWHIMYHSTVSLEICGFDRSVSWITAFVSPWFIALMDHHWCLLGVQTTTAERLAMPSQILQLNMNSSHHDHQDVYHRLHLEFWNWGLRTFCTFRHYCSAFAGDWQGGNLIGWLFFCATKNTVLTPIWNFTQFSPTYIHFGVLLHHLLAWIIPTIYANFKSCLNIGIN